MWNFVGGHREPVVIDFIIIGLTYYICRNRFPWKFVIISVVPLAILVGFMNSFRYAAQKMENDHIDGPVITAIQQTLSGNEEGKSASFIVTAMARLNDLDSIAAVYAWTPSTRPYAEGETYSRIPEAMIPRQLWKDKPAMVLLTLNEFFFRHDIGSSPLTTPGEGYLNFSWLGVLLAGVGCALLLRLTELIFAHILWNGGILPVYVASLAVFARSPPKPQQRGAPLSQSSFFSRSCSI